MYDPLCRPAQVGRNIPEVFRNDRISCAWNHCKKENMVCPCRQLAVCVVRKMNARKINVRLYPYCCALVELPRYKPHCKRSIVAVYSKYVKVIWVRSRNSSFYPHYSIVPHYSHCLWIRSIPWWIQYLNCDVSSRSLR